MTRSPFLLAALLAVFLSALGTAVFLPDRPAIAADEKKALRPALGQPLKAAQDAIAQKKYKEAMADIDKTDAISDKTPYERLVIAQMRTAAYIGMGDYASATKGFEEELATGLVEPDDSVKIVGNLVRLYYDAKDFPKAIEYINRYYREGGTDDEFHTLLAEAYYQQGDYANAEKSTHALIQNFQKSGTTPPEVLLELYMSSAYQIKDAAGHIDALEMLVATYPKKDYWNDLFIEIAKKPNFSQSLELDLDRLLIATGVMQQPNEFMEAAELAITDGLPGDAKTFIDQGFAAGALGKGPDAARQQKMSDLSKSLSATDIKGLPQIAQQATTGESLVKLAEAYASYAQYDKAIAAFEQGIQKDGLKNAPAEKLRLGVTYLKAGQKAKAKDTLKSITAADGTQDLAQLWLIWGGLK